jgi:hypothetical protein
LDTAGRRLESFLPAGARQYRTFARRCGQQAGDRMPSRVSVEQPISRVRVGALNDEPQTIAPSLAGELARRGATEPAAPETSRRVTVDHARARADERGHDVSADPHEYVL